MEPEKKSNGAFVGLIIIIIILILGGIYIWQLKEKEMEQIKMEAVVITTEDFAELDTLEQDLNATDANIGVDVDTVN